MDTGNTLGGIGLFISLCGIVYTAINHKKIRGTCCGKKIDFSIDIDTTADKKKPGDESKRDCDSPPKEELPKYPIRKSPKVSYIED